MRIAICTDAWHPQVNGVVRTLAATVERLIARGHEVELVDRQSGPALETSFANAGEVSPGYSAPWAGPGVPIKAIKWMLMQHSPLVIWPPPSRACRRSC